MSDTLGGAAAFALASDDGVIVSVTVDAKPPAKPPPPKVAPPPRTHVPGTQPPAHHHPHGPLASTGLPAIQLLLLAAVVVALGVLLIRVARPSSEVGNA